MRTVTVSEAKARLSRLLDEVHKTHQVVSISKGGLPEGVLLSHDEYESLIETLEILSDPELTKALRQSEKEIKAGKLVPLRELERA